MNEQIDPNKAVMQKMMKYLIGAAISFVVFLIIIFVIVRVVRLAWGG